MGVLIYPTSKSIDGPWLLDKNDLEELDVIIDKIYSKFSESVDIKSTESAFEKKSNSTKEEIKKEIESERKYIKDYKRDNKTVTILYNNEIKFKGKTIKEIIVHTQKTDFKAKKIYVTVNYGSSHKFLLIINNNDYGNIIFEIDCYDNEIRDELLFDVNNWINKRKQNRLIQLWSDWGKIVSYGILAIMFLSLLFIKISNNNQQAYDIINHGVDSTNIYKAVELTLSSQVGYSPEHPANNTSILNIIIHSKVWFIGILLTIILFVSPKTTIGIGKSEDRMKFYKFWIKLNIFSIPILIISGPIFSYIIDWFSKL